MISNWIAQHIGCIRVFRFEVLPGQEQAYQEYLRDVVEPIDEVAFADGAFLEVLILTQANPCGKSGTQCRVFTFRDVAQRDAFPGLIAEAARQFDQTEEARDLRKAYADTLRTVVGVDDHELQDHRRVRPRRSANT